MKKLTLISLFLILGVLFTQAQTQRIVLYEGFSNASCPPCAQANPGINTLLKANSSKVVGIKYQVSWPGFDPMNKQNAKDSDVRRSYYGVDAVPTTVINGVKGKVLNQANINEQYETPSPFNLDIEHEFNADIDSVFVRCIVTAAKDLEEENLLLHVAMLEKEIHFSAAPGANGEKSFYHVMRKMYPDANGTLLKGSWKKGDSDTIYFSEGIPEYIYNLTQIHFIAFIQSKTSKAVHQAAKNNTMQLQDYLVITKHNIPVEPGCYDELELELTIKNQGSNLVESFQIEYGLIDNTPMIFDWEGNMEVGESIDLKLPSLSVLQGTTTVFAEIKNPNSVIEYPKLHAKVQAELSVINEFFSIPMFEDFKSTTFPPENWSNISYDESAKWERASVGGFGQTSGGSALISFFESPKGEIDLLYLKPLDFSSMTEVEMSFSVAYARYNASYSDALRVQISTNCGATWSNIYNKNGSALATAPDKTGFFTPNASQWRKEIIDLSNYAGQSNVLIRFNALSGYGNALYVDDVYFGESTASISENDPIMTSLKVYPNPISDEFSIDFNIKDATDVQVQVFDQQGKLIEQIIVEQVQTGTNQIKVNSTAWTKGMYNIFVTTTAGVISRKLIK